MTKRERVDRACAFETVDRFPFVPAIYEHKARLIGKRPSDICRRADLLHESLLKELETYDPDMLVVGVDVYNVEAEALGSELEYFIGTDDVPAVSSRLLRDPGDLEKLGLPDPESDGRMPLFPAVAKKLRSEVGDRLYVRGALSGPFSLAGALTGTDDLLVATIENPGFVRDLLEFTAKVTVEFGKAFLSRGVDVVVFDSKASPQASSPRVFREFVSPVYRDVVMPGLREAGARRRPLIIGGDTTPILEDLLETGATQILCDAGSDLEVFKTRCGRAMMPFRGNVDARLVHRGTPEEIRREAFRMLEAVKDSKGFLFGCGVVAYDCEPSHVLALRDALFEFSGC